MIFKKLSKTISLSLAILVACFATSSAQANQTFTEYSTVKKLGFIGGITFLTGFSTFLGIGSFNTLYSIKKSPHELLNPGDLAATKWLSYAGLICALNGLYTATTVIWQTKPTHANHDALGALSSIRTALEQNK